MATIEEIRQQYPQYADISDGELMYGMYKNFYSDVPVMGFVKTLISDVGLSMDEVKKFSALAKEGGADFSFQQAAPSVGGRAAGTARGLLQGLTLGAGEEIVAGGTAAARKLLQQDPRALGDIYEQELERERGRIQQFRETDPLLAYGSELTGAVAVPLAGAGQTIRGTAALAGGTGAAAGFLGSEGGFQERATGAAVGGVLGALLGAGLQAGGKALGASFEDYMSRRAARAVAEGADSIQQLRNEANAAYNAARASGVEIDRAAYDDMVTRVIADVAGAPGRPVREKLIPKSADVLQAMKDMSARTVGIDDLDYFRQLAQTPAGMVTDKAEQRAASIIIKGLDDFVEGLSPTQIATNPASAREAVENLGRARELWGRMRRTQTIQEIIDTAAAGGGAGGFESRLKNQIGAIIRDPKKRRGFSPAELSLLSQIQKGTPVGRILAGISYLGFSPSGGRAAPLVGGMTTGAVAGGFAGGALGALLGAGAEVAGTTLLRALREMSLEEQARLYAQVIASGKADQAFKAYPSVMRYLEAIATRAAVGGSTQTPYDILSR